MVEWNYIAWRLKLLEAQIQKFKVNTKHNKRERNMKMKQSYRTKFITMLVLLMAFNVSAQSVPGTINHQGQLLDSGGSPITTEVTVIFSLWDNVSAGTQLGSAWSDSDLVTPDANGVFSTDIGDEPKKSGDRNQGNQGKSGDSIPI